MKNKPDFWPILIGSMFILIGGFAWYFTEDIDNPLARLPSLALIIFGVSFITAYIESKSK